MNESIDTYRWKKNENIDMSPRLQPNTSVGVSVCVSSLSRKTPAIVNVMKRVCLTSM